MPSSLSSSILLLLHKNTTSIQTVGEHSQSFQRHIKVTVNYEQKTIKKNKHFTKPYLGLSS